MRQVAASTLAGTPRGSMSSTELVRAFAILRDVEMASIRGARVVAVKAAAISGVVWLMWHRLPRFFEWGCRYHEIRPYIGFYTACLLISGVTASVTVILITHANRSRVAVNSLIIFGCFLIGCVFGDPLTRGSYDHLSGVETYRGQLILGVVGTLCGYGITLAWEYHRRGSAKAHS